MTSLREMRECINKFRPVLSQPGYISIANGGGEIYGIVFKSDFSPKCLSSFGRACYIGYLGLVKRFIETEKAPDLGGTELPLEFGYATILVCGASNALDNYHADAERFKYRETLEFLVSHGLPLNIPEALGQLALFHAVECSIVQPYKPALTYELLQLGADVNYRDRAGNTALLMLFIRSSGMPNFIQLMELLLAFGADPDIRNANDRSAAYMAAGKGSKVNAVMDKWRRKGNGEVTTIIDKACDACGRRRFTLKNCSRCQVAKYCSKECQRSEWETHKELCKPFDPSTSLIIIPRYSDDYNDVEFAETFAPLPPDDESFRKEDKYRIFPIVNRRRTKPPKGPFPKSIVIKVMIPTVQTRGNGQPPSEMIIISTKKLELYCCIVKTDTPMEYTILWEYLLRRTGPAKRAYFAAELRGPHELVIKIDRSLSEQPF